MPSFNTNGTLLTNPSFTTKLSGESKNLIGVLFVEIKCLRLRLSTMKRKALDFSGFFLKRIVRVGSLQTMSLFG